MKHLLIIAVAALLIGLSSCQKPEQEFCWECTTNIQTPHTVWVTVPGGNPWEKSPVTKWKVTKTEKSVSCGITSTEIKEVEQKATFSNSQMRVVTRCKRN